MGVAAFSRFTVTSRRSLVKVDKAIALEEAALFGCAVMTGVGAVLNTARVQAGQSVAVVGLGGVGLNALLGALLVGADPVIALDLVPEKLALARQLGATHALNAGDKDALAEAREGAHAVGAGFVVLNVFEERKAKALEKLAGPISDPSVLVFKRPGTIAVRLEGFADATTVAQAAQNTGAR